MSTSIAARVPKTFTEFITLGETPKKRAEGILAYFDRSDRANGTAQR